MSSPFAGIRPSRRRFGLLFVLSILVRIAVLAETVVIDPANTQQIIRGFGGATAFLPTTPLSQQDLDSIFGTGPNQIGLSILRIRIASDEAWRALELSNAKGAVARGAAVVATPWSPPVSMKTNGSLVDGSLKESSCADYARYLNDFASYMAANGAPLYAVSVQNEPDIDVTYESCDWTSAQMLDFCRNYAGAITAARVLAPESFQFRRGISDALLNDAAATTNISIVGGHIYGGGLEAYPLAVARGKDVWMTEHLDLSTDWAGALATGKEIHDCLATANFNAYIWWYVRRSYGPLGEDGVITKRGHVMSQFAKFVRPGYVRIGASPNPTNDVFVSAYKGDKLVIVAVNLGTSSVSQSFSLLGASPVSFTLWVTSETLNMAAQTPLTVSSGTFAAVLPPKSVTTFVGELPVSKPTILEQPKGHAVALGSSFVLDVRADGEETAFQWKREGVPLAGATLQTLVVRSARDSDAGNYSVVVSNPRGAVESAEAVVRVTRTDNPGRLLAISTRSPVGIGDGVQIAGFILRGDAPKQILVRGLGPKLAVSSGLQNALTDPVLSLVDSGSGLSVGENDDWEASLISVFAKCGVEAPGAGSRDAAAAPRLSPGIYTAQVRGKTEASGVGLVEVYDADFGDNSGRLEALSSRTKVSVGDEVQIAGFIVGGETALTVVIRASGPSLAEFAHLGGTLSDPTLELRDVRGELVAASDDWNPSLAAHFAAVGVSLWKCGSKDAALVRTLDPGAYTAVVQGKAGGTGLALVEVYSEN